MMPSTMLATLAGIFVAGATSGATGLAFPLIAGPILLLTYSPTEAVALTAMCSLTGQLFSIGLLRRTIAYELRLPMIVPGLLGVPVGSTLLERCDPALVRVALGTAIVLAGAWGLIQPSLRRPLAGSGEPLVGLIGGLTGGLVGASSIAPAIWCALRGLSKEQQRAVTQPFILTMQIASLAALAAGGALGRALPNDYVIMLLPLLMGVGSGVACFRWASSAAATRAVLVLVTASGVAMLFA